MCAESLPLLDSEITCVVSPLMSYTSKKRNISLFFSNSSVVKMYRRLSQTVPTVSPLEPPKTEQGPEVPLR